MPLEMKIERLNPTCAVAVLHGGLTMGASLKSIDGSVQQLIGQGVRQLVLDLSGCGYADSAGLGFVVYAYGLITSQGGALRLCGVGERLMELLKRTRTDAILPCDPSRAVSLQELASSPIANS